MTQPSPNRTTRPAPKEAKAIISLYAPPALFMRAERAAKKAGVSRNQFMVDAIEEAVSLALASKSKPAAAAVGG